MEFEHLTSSLEKLITIPMDDEILRDFDREQLKQLYFSDFHPHWPFLHRDTNPQPDILMNTVMIAGLWMVGTAQAKRLAEEHHDRLSSLVCKKLVSGRSSAQPSH